MLKASLKGAEKNSTNKVPYSTLEHMRQAKYCKKLSSEGIALL